MGYSKNSTGAFAFHLCRILNFVEFLFHDILGTAKKFFRLRRAEHIKLCIQHNQTSETSSGGFTIARMKFAATRRFAFLQYLIQPVSFKKNKIYFPKKQLKFCKKNKNGIKS